MGDKTGELERLYCPPLDTSTFYAIVSDFDLNTPSGVAGAKEILDAIKASAEAEDTAGFDPSGSSNPRDANLETIGSVTATSEDADVRSGESTGITDAASSLDAFTFEDSNVYDKGIDALTNDEKKSLLKEMFRTLKPFDIDFAFQKRKGDFGAAVEDLLSQQFLQEEAIASGSGTGTPKGIDGFAGTGANGHKHKGKGKSRGKGHLAPVDLNARLVNGYSSSANRWQQGQDDVKFITSRTHLDEALVKSAHNKTGHNLKATLVAILQKSPVDDLKCTTDLDDPLVQSNIVDLATEFPSLSIMYIKPIILLTHPLFIAAKELAEVIASGPGEMILPTYAATKVPTHDGGNGLLEDESSFLASNAELPIGASYSALRSSAFAQASAAFRKSRSSPHMGGAAAYYASVGHAANAAMKRERAFEANSRVSLQSGDDFCDLHGVTVQDATRIAKQYVERWWDARQEWAREGKVMGKTEYRVVVGRGSHSTEKKGKLGPAVAKMLKAGGWRVDEQVGEIIVRGRARK